MAGDTLSTAAVIAGGAGILLTGQNWIDPVLSLLIAALILWSSLGIVRETLNILLEGTPRGISLAAIRSGMGSVEGVVNVHDLHVWSLGSKSSALACHVTIADIPPSESACILVEAQSCAQETTSTSAHHHPVRAHRLRGARRAAWCRPKRWPAASANMGIRINSTSGDPFACPVFVSSSPLCALVLLQVALGFAGVAFRYAGPGRRCAHNVAPQLEALSGEYTDARAEPDTPLSFYIQDGKLVVESERNVPRN
jgi:hypothetical protein